MDELTYYYKWFYLEDGVLKEVPPTNSGYDADHLNPDWRWFVNTIGFDSVESAENRLYTFLHENPHLPYREYVLIKIYVAGQ